MEADGPTDRSASTSSLSYRIPWVEVRVEVHLPTARSGRLTSTLPLSRDLAATPSLGARVVLLKVEKL